jgi:hypothetical protein
MISGMFSSGVFWQSLNIIIRKSHEGNFNNPQVSNVLPPLPREFLAWQMVKRFTFAIRVVTAMNMILIELNVTKATRWESRGSGSWY